MEKTKSKEQIIKGFDSFIKRIKNEENKKQAEVEKDEQDLTKLEESISYYDEMIAKLTDEKYEDPETGKILTQKRLPEDLKQAEELKEKRNKVQEDKEKLLQSIEDKKVKEAEKAAKKVPTQTKVSDKVDATIKEMNSLIKAIEISKKSTEIKLTKKEIEVQEYYMDENRPEGNETIFKLYQERDELKQTIDDLTKDLNESKEYIDKLKNFDTKTLEWADEKNAEEIAKQNEAKRQAEINLKIEIGKKIEAERATQKAAAEKAEADRIAAEKAEADRIAAEKAEADRIAAEKAEADRIAAEKAEADRIAAEKAEADRIAAENKQKQEPKATEMIIDNEGKIYTYQDDLLLTKINSMDKLENIESKLNVKIYHSLGYDDVESFQKSSEVYNLIQEGQINARILLGLAGNKEQFENYINLCSGRDYDIELIPEIKYDLKGLSKSKLDKNEKMELYKEGTIDKKFFKKHDMKSLFSINMGALEKFGFASRAILESLKTKIIDLLPALDPERKGIPEAELKEAEEIAEEENPKSNWRETLKYKKDQAIKATKDKVIAKTKRVLKDKVNTEKIKAGVNKVSGKVKDFLKDEKSSEKQENPEKTPERIIEEDFYTAEELSEKMNNASEIPLTGARPYQDEGER